MKVQLHKGQKRMWKEIQDDFEDGVRHFTCVCPRQWGKTYLFQALVIYWGTRPNKKIPMLWTSQYLANSRIIMDNIVDMIQDEPFFKSSNKQDMKIIFANGSFINFRASDNPKGIRGLSNKICFLDEMAHYPNLDDFWNKIVRPTTLAHRDAQVYMISTPNGRNLFYDMAMRGKSNIYKPYGLYTGQYIESPYVDLDEIENARRELPSDVFAQEYNAEFLDVNLGVFRNIEICSTLMDWVQPEYGLRCHAGVDFGRRNDETVCTIMDDNGRVCYIWKSVPGMGWDEIIEKVIFTLKRYRVFHCYAESNSMGDVLVDQMRKLFPRIEGLYTTNDRKSELVENLRYSLEHRKILLPNKTFYSDLDTQLNNFIFKITPQGKKMSYQAADGHKDDHVISLCLALNSVRKFSMLGNYTIL